jgi:hypothetical protein
MVRRSSAVVLGVALLLSAAGCRLCDRTGWFSSNTNQAAPCQLTGSGRPMEGCFDAITGQPVPCPPSATVVPGGAYPAPTGVIPNGRPDELPMPDLIPPAGVPMPAQPSPAPPVPTVGPAAKGGTPVKGVTTK